MTHKMPPAVIAQCKELQKSLQREIDRFQSGEMKSTAERDGDWVDTTDETLAERKAQLETVNRILAGAVEEEIAPAGDDDMTAPPDWPE
jgi:hypothetical protein